MSCCGNCEKNKEEILKKIDGFSHQIFSYHLDLLQFMDMIYDFIQDTDIQGVKNSSVLYELIHKAKNNNERSSNRWK
jgi:hypothetical protein